MTRSVSGGSGGNSSGRVAVAPVAAQPMIPPVPAVVTAAVGVGGAAAQVTGLL